MIKFQKLSALLVAKLDMQAEIWHYNEIVIFSIELYRQIFRKYRII